MRRDSLQPPAFSLRVAPKRPRCCSEESAARGPVSRPVRHLRPARHGVLPVPLHPGQCSFDLASDIHGFYLSEASALGLHTWATCTFGLNPSDPISGRCAFLPDAVVLEAIHVAPGCGANMQGPRRAAVETTASVYSSWEFFMGMRLAVPPRTRPARHPRPVLKPVR